VAGQVGGDLPIQRAGATGGTVLVGVEDDTRVVGVDPRALDPQMRALHSMIRDSIDPEPPYVVRAAEVGGKTVLLVEVSGGGRWYAVNPAKPEFYLRRGGSTVPARVDEIAIGFGYRQSASTLW
jgi:predicted HTH transcriptional regulator